MYHKTTDGDPNGGINNFHQPRSALFLCTLTLIVKSPQKLADKASYQCFTDVDKYFL